MAVVTRVVMAIAAVLSTCRRCCPVVSLWSTMKPSRRTRREVIIELQNVRLNPNGDGAGKGNAQSMFNPSEKSLTWGFLVDDTVIIEVEVKLIGVVLKWST
ncbi:hypothetical protein Patl1_24348 [Pistacia atlantica]|uniref:Uncharacterized protein n=1 Tax=Pistacia atlantica TaxID=434234 RepID=A0ACC1A032_9ROSI|nr:hypothetical protein Patl1_24348 [Pistacia atlantica]